MVADPEQEPYGLSGTCIYGGRGPDSCAKRTTESLVQHGGEVIEPLAGRRYPRIHTQQSITFGIQACTSDVPTIWSWRAARYRHRNQMRHSQFGKTPAFGRNASTEVN